MSQAGDDGSGAGSLPAGLARELARANRLREALFEISNLTRTTFELDAFYADLHRIVSSLMYAENFVIAIRAPESGELRFEYYRDSVDTDLTPATINKRPQAEIENSLTGWVAREGKLRHLTPEEVLEIRASLGLKRIGSPAADWMGAPLRGREHIVGAVVVQSYDPAICYTEDDEQLLLFVCDHVTAQLEQRQADRALRRLNDELEARVQLRTRELEEQIEERRRGERLQRALFEITSLASEALTLKELYPRLHAVIGELIYARNMYIALADERRRLLEFVYYVDDVDDSTAPLDIPESKENVGPTLRVYFRGEPLLWLATESDLPAGARGSPSQAWLGVPLRAGERVIGALVVQSYDAGIVYGEADKRLLTFVAQHVGTTIERRRAKLALQRAKDELERRVVERTQRLATTNNELRSTLDQLENTQRQLVEAEKMASLGSLVAGVAHEINTPLGVAVTAASHIERQLRRLAQLGEDPNRMDEVLAGVASLMAAPCELLQDNLSRSARMVKSFRQVAADQTTEDRRVFNFSQYLGEILTSLGPKIRKNGHQLKFEAPEEVTVDGYPFALYPIISNLIVNTVTHGFDDDDNGTIDIAVTADDNAVRLRYADDGRGMRPEVLERIFEPFFTTRRGQGGTGLGMHIVYNHIVRLGGTVNCRSRPGEGFEATIRIPRHMPDLNLQGRRS